jgi:hypothetical protein
MILIHSFEKGLDPVGMPPGSQKPFFYSGIFRVIKNNRMPMRSR